MARKNPKTPDATHPLSCVLYIRVLTLPIRSYARKFNDLQRRLSDLYGRDAGLGGRVGLGAG